jgi:hypothetical protein
VQCRRTHRAAARVIGGPDRQDRPSFACRAEPARIPTLPSVRAAQAAPPYPPVGRAGSRPSSSAGSSPGSGIRSPADDRHRAGPGARPRHARRPGHGVSARRPPDAADQRWTDRRGSRRDAGRATDRRRTLTPEKPSIIGRVTPAVWSVHKSPLGHCGGSTPPAIHRRDGGAEGCASCTAGDQFSAPGLHVKRAAGRPATGTATVVGKDGCARHTSSGPPISPPSGCRRRPSSWPTAGWTSPDSAGRGDAVREVKQLLRRLRENAKLRQPKRSSRAFSLPVNEPPRL